ncbi:hypothetical protein [Deinococcus pimensis]|uniref:hypothetical protein n=1 Tax=Deinococcus pimensis TaxID=309888 RepID=UPI000482AC54|nr:hypothetical protein [Deinococcus pimensis]
MNTHTTESSSTPTTSSFARLRALGVATVLASPAMLVEVYRHGFQKVANEDTDPLGALLYGLFSLGWLCAALGLREVRAAGRGRAGGALSALLVVTVTLALLQSAMDLLGVPTTHAAYVVTDLAWPLSMLLTFVVGIAALVARTVSPGLRAALLLCGISLPVTILSKVLLGQEPSGVVFAWHTFLGWAALGAALLATAKERRS